MSVRAAKERMAKLKNKVEPTSEELILKELKKQNLMIEQMRFNLNNLAWWYLYIGLSLAAFILVITFMFELSK